MSFASVLSVGTGNSPKAYSQTELLNLFQINDDRIKSLFKNSAIEKRYLTLPPLGTDGYCIQETQGDLLDKHTKTGLNMGSDAIIRCLEKINAKIEDVCYLCCVSSTGFIAPGFSALLIEKMQLSKHCSRLDIVGMGCNAGLNGLAAVNNWACQHPGQLALLVCIEVCSAAYVFDGTMRTAVVNSLFGDGAAAAAVCNRQLSTQSGYCSPKLLNFSSLIIPSQIKSMHYDWDNKHGRFSFYLDPEVPYVIGAHAEIALQKLLGNSGVRKSEINHWIVHSGGKKVIDSIRINLGLTSADMRHTINILRNYGNLSSGSFLFSYEQLLNEGVIRQGDYAVMMTMGPGATIEMALLRW